MHYCNAHYSNVHYSNVHYGSGWCDSYSNRSIMKFYNREREIKLLQSIRLQSNTTAQMTVVVGRRRIGKTSLLKKALMEENCVYLFVAKKSEILLCAEFIEAIENSLNVKVFGTITHFKDIFAYLMDLSKSRNFTVIIDEFQEFSSVNPSVYSEMQNIWDSNKELSKINLVFCGSIYSLMKRIFENSKEPLFARATERIHLKPFSVNTLQEIIKDYKPNYSNEDFLAFYMITGGVAKYVEQLVNKNAFSLEDILNEVFRENSLFLEEGKNVLIEEFGKEYAIYFSILSLIANGKTSRSEIESILEITIGGYLERLEIDFNIIRKVRPVLTKSGSRNIKYRLEDNFLNFWFRFVYKYKSAVEIGNYDYIKTIIQRDYSVFSGLTLEKYFIERMKESNNYSEIGTYWEKGNMNEIDIVAINELDKRVVVAEVKRNKEKISQDILKEKSKKLLEQFKGYEIEFQSLSLDDM